jgi:sialate O-acetylesterase
MMHPLEPYACRGLVWYQGERNTQSMFGMLEKPWFSRNSGMLKYGDTLNAWIERYRRSWDNPQMHFMVVMLPGYGKLLDTSPTIQADHPTAHSWAWIRESQLKSLELQHTSVANTIDLGDVKNIHPRDKLPIGKRLALLAANSTLNQNVEAYGPMIDHAEPQAGKVVVHFDHAQGLKTIDGNAPTAFWLADNSEKWFKADAEINGQTVILSSANLKTPLYVRYAFSGKPNVNLINAAELPAYPFRTDTFKP